MTKTKILAGTKSKPRITRGSANVFADLGLPNAEQELIKARAGSFSVGRLLEFLTGLGQDVEVTVRPTRREHGEMSVRVG
jgi:hypothetical protein